jgi:hypothetical protein
MRRNRSQPLYETDIRDVADWWLALCGQPSEVGVPPSEWQTVVWHNANEPGWNSAAAG